MNLPISRMHMLLIRSCQYIAPSGFEREENLHTKPHARMYTHTCTHTHTQVMIVGNSNLATKFVFWLACNFFGHLLNESNVAFVGFLGLPVDRSILSLFLLTCRLFLCGHLKYATRRHHGGTILLSLFLRGCRRCNVRYLVCAVWAGTCHTDR